jgi:hypothetical protein
MILRCAKANLNLQGFKTLQVQQLKTIKEC